MTQGTEWSVADRAGYMALVGAAARAVETRHAMLTTPEAVDSDPSLADALPEGMLTARLVAAHKLMT